MTMVALGITGVDPGRPPVILCLSDYDTLGEDGVGRPVPPPRFAASLLKDVDREAARAISASTLPLIA